MDSLQKPDTQLLSIRQVAALCGVSLRTAFRWLDAGILPDPIRIGSGPNPMIRFRKAEIESWIQAGCPRREVAKA